MSLITEEQRTHCKVAQFYQALKASTNKNIFERVMSRIEDVDFKVLADKSEELDPKIRGGTLLHIACYLNHIKAFENLLKRKANFTTKNDAGNTALHQVFYNIFCESSGNLKTANAILDNKFVSSVLQSHVQSRNSENPRSADGLSHFHIACVANQVEAVQLFLNSGVCVDESVSEASSIFAGYTPLHFAARFCRYKTAESLLQHRANVRAKDSNDLSPMQVAVERRLKLSEWKDEKNCADIQSLNELLEENEKIIRLFLENDEMLDFDNKGFCNFYAACTLSDSSLVETFIPHFDINSIINMDSCIWPGYTSLHFAVPFNIETVKVLLENGGNINAQDAKRITPLDLCVQKYHPEDSHKILSAVPTFNDYWFSDDKTKLMDFLYSMRSIRTLKTFFQTTSNLVHLPINCPFWPGSGILHLFLHFFNHYSVEKMLKKYLNVGAMFQDAKGCTPFHLAFYYQKYELVDLILENQLVVMDVLDDKGLSHLHIACSRANADVVQILLSKDANVNNQYRGKTLSSELYSGWAPLHLSVTRGDRHSTELLLQHSADANTTDSNGITPIHCILKSYPRQPSILIGNLLFASGIVKDIVSHKTGLSHLHVASFIGNKDAVQLLLVMGANVNAVTLDGNDLQECGLSPDLSGCTPLYLAFKANQLEIVELLLQAGADLFGEKSISMKIFQGAFNNFGERSPFYSKEISNTRIFTLMLESDVAVRQLVKENFGLTLLHIVCYLRDIQQIEKLLHESPWDINVQLHFDSPVWPGFTALHVLITSTLYIDDLKNAMRALLDRGADVMLTNKSGDTPLHLALTIPDESAYDHLRLLSQYHKDFSINPVNEQGLSHFHLACILSEYAAVEQFLKHGIDVNLPIKYRDRTIIFQTPLHLMLQYRWKLQSDINSQIQTLDLLLKCGADVNAQDENGSTPILKAAVWGPLSQVYFLKFIKADADITWTTSNGESMQEILLRSTDLLKDEFSFLSPDCYHFNIFNLIDERGFLALLISCESDFRHRKSILETLLECPCLFSVDEMKRTPIHNIVSNCTAVIEDNEFTSLIERFINMGYDIDTPDFAGKTALHTAAYFHNKKAVLGLILAGADINICDDKNQTAFSQMYQNQTWLNNFTNYYTRAEDGEEIKTILAAHTRKLEMCGLEVKLKNVELSYRQNFKNPIELTRPAFRRELENAKSVTIKMETSKLTLSDFLSETGVVASRPSMASQTDRDTVDNLLENFNIERFPLVANLLKVQHRKMLKRLKLMQPATEALQDLIGNVDGFHVPDICCRMVIRFLTTSEVKNLIESVVN